MRAAGSLSTWLNDAMVPAWTVADFVSEAASSLLQGHFSLGTDARAACDPRASKSLPAMVPQKAPIHHRDSFNWCLPKNTTAAQASQMGQR